MKEVSTFLTVTFLAVMLLLLATHLIAKQTVEFDNVLEKLTAY